MDTVSYRPDSDYLEEQVSTLTVTARLSSGLQSHPTHGCPSARWSTSTVMVRSNLETEMPQELKVKCWLSHFFFLSLLKQTQREPCSVKQNIGKGFKFYIIQLGGGCTHL